MSYGRVGYLSIADKGMGIFRAVGLGVAIVILKLLMPAVMSGFEGTLSSFFGVTQLLLANIEYTLGG